MSVKIVKGTKSLISKKETSTEVLSTEERDDVFTQLLMGNDATSEVETSRGTFTIKFPKQKDSLAIGRLMCINRGGLPASSFDVETENRNLICSTLNILVIGAPSWFENAKTKVKSFSFEEVPDEEFLLELYQKACSFRDEVQASFKEKKGAESTGIPAGEGVVNNVDANILNGDGCETVS